MVEVVPNAPSAAMTGGTGGRTVSEGYQRLSLLSAIIGIAATLGLGVAIVEGQFGPMDPLATIGYLSPVLVAMISLFVWLGCRMGVFSPAAFLGVALLYEFVVSAALGSGVTGWQWSLGPEALEWLESQGPRPWNFGNQVPWVGVWVILFAMLIPMAPTKHLVGAVLSALTVPGWALLSPVLTGFPADLLVQKKMLTVLAVSVTTYPTVFAVGMAYFAARHVHGLNRELSKARRMGSYHLLEKLGEGGMGEVWLAEHRMLARTAALKLVRTSKDGAPLPESTLTRFEREVQATAQLRSPHTIEVHDYGLTDDGTFYYVMERLDGLDLDALVRSEGRQPWGRVVQILIQACHSLGEAHEVGMVHRDIKPANVFLCRIGRDVDQVKILDFGLVKGQDEEVEAVELTTAGAFVGTPAYASPEMARGGAKDVDGRSDLYSLGCIAWFLLVGRPVFEADTVMDILMKHVGDKPMSPSAFEESVPTALDRIVLKCLEKDPGDRFSSVDEMAIALRKLDSKASWTGDQARQWWETHERPEGSRSVEATVAYDITVAGL